MPINKNRKREEKQTKDVLRCGENRNKKKNKTSKTTTTKKR
jgi:hypothetical protein